MPPPHPPPIVLCDEASVERQQLISLVARLVSKMLDASTVCNSEPGDLNHESQNSSSSSVTTSDHLPETVHVPTSRIQS